ncbi:aldo/keto reductase [Patulibacter sp. NPDC049589]|uniref:aldo/keto reductase n=1 Tax=Patulibacter sp. NPDC049589 TaxID=3154731 RepID=UPI0034266626
MTSTGSLTPRALGPDQVPVGPVGLGCMGMSWAYGTEGDEPRSHATIHRAIAAYADLGVPPLIDTADVYGPFVNEELVGRALAGRRDEVLLATKVGLVSEAPAPGEPPRLRRDARPERIRGAVEDSLRRLGVDHVDLYQLHRVDPDVPIEESWGAMAGLVAAGLVRAIGLSAVTVEEAQRAHAVHPVASIQSELSLWTRDPIENGTLAWAAEHGASFLPFSPLGRGVLTGAIDPTTLGSGDFRSTLGRFRGDAWEQNRSTIDVVAEQAARLGATNAQVALAWVLAQGPHVVPIPGTTKPERLEENVGAAALVLDDEATAALAATTAAVGANTGA